MIEHLERPNPFRPREAEPTSAALRWGALMGATLAFVSIAYPGHMPVAHDPDDLQAVADLLWRMHKSGEAEARADILASCRRGDPEQAEIHWLEVRPHFLSAAFGHADIPRRLFGLDTGATDPESGDRYFRDGSIVDQDGKVLRGPRADRKEEVAR